MQQDFKFFKQLRTLYALGFIRGKLRTQELFLHNAFELMTRKIPAHADQYLWHSLFAPSELIHATGAVAIECDFMSAYLCAFGYANKLINFAEQEHAHRRIRQVTPSHDPFHDRPCRGARLPMHHLDVGKSDQDANRWPGLFTFL